MKIDGIHPGNPIEHTPFPGRQIHEKNASSFKETLSTFLSEVNDSQKVASDAQKAFMAGEVNDVHQVISKSEEANVSFNMLMELRSKSLDFHQEVTRIKL